MTHGNSTSTSRYVLEPAGGGGLCRQNARILHSRSAASKMYVLMRMIVSFRVFDEVTGHGDVSCRITLYVLRHLNIHHHSHYIKVKVKAVDLYSASSC